MTIRLHRHPLSGHSHRAQLALSLMGLSHQLVDVDLMATVSEVTQDGVETFIQNGWLRASIRKLATGIPNLKLMTLTGGVAEPSPDVGRTTDLHQPLTALFLVDEIDRHQPFNMSVEKPDFRLADRA